MVMGGGKSFVGMGKETERRGEKGMELLRTQRMEWLMSEPWVMMGWRGNACFNGIGNGKEKGQGKGRIR